MEVADDRKSERCLLGIASPQPEQELVVRVLVIHSSRITDYLSGRDRNFCGERLGNPCSEDLVRLKRPIGTWNLGWWREAKILTPADFLVSNRE